jgi:hypothetical protein
MRAAYADKFLISSKMLQPLNFEVFTEEMTAIKRVDSQFMSDRLPEPSGSVHV